MSSVLRRGACPTLAAPMATGDGLLARLNPVSGGIAPATLAAIAQAAARFGNGLLEVTARGSLQIRGLAPSTAPQFTVAVDRLDIKVRSGVPVETGPLAGLDPQEIADPTPLAEKIREGIAKAGLSARLGPKVSVVVDGGGRLHLAAVLADVRLEAIRIDDDVLWRVAIGGTCETAKLLGVVEAETACAIVIALLVAVAAKGRTARARELELAELATLLSCMTPIGCLVSPPSVLPDISPSRGEISLHGRLAQTSTLENENRHRGRPISPLEMSGRTEGGVTERVLKKNGAADRSRTITTLPLADGRTALGIGLPFGQATAEQVTAFADGAARLGADEIRFAPGRALLALCPTTAATDVLRKAAERSGFVTDAFDPRLAVVACAGAPACAFGYLPARGIAAEIAAQPPLGDGQSIHVSGCAKQCAKPARVAFTLIGTAQGCEIHRGDGTRGAPVARVANEDAAAAFERAAKLYRNDKKTGKEAAIGPGRLGKARGAATNHREA